MISLDRFASLDFVVPPENEAREPAESRGLARDRVRMLVSDRRTGALRHERFDATPSLLEPGEVLVVNDSATLPAALRATRADGSSLPLHVADEIEDGLWVVEPRGATSPGEAFALTGGARAVITAPLRETSARLWYARIDTEMRHAEYLRAYGVPIRYPYVDADISISYYETIFARSHASGSAEMPSAGWPFSARTLEALHARGIEVRTITLHAGVSSPEAHEPPQAERFAVPEVTAHAVNRARAENRRIIAVGTTVVRALESVAREGYAVAGSGRTERIVSPLDPPCLVDGLLTGFHEPRASHLTLLESFLDRASLAHAYEAALATGYLWHEFGDVHLIV